MALDKLVDSSQLDGAMGSTADAIREKTGGEGLLTWDLTTGFADAIGAISTLDEETADATATSSDILNGKTAYVQGEKVTGNIPTKTALTVNGKTVTALAGHYASDTSADVADGSVIQNAPTVNTSTGVITATSTVTAGYVSADTKSNTSQLSTQSGKTVTPTESEQTAVASGKYTIGAVKVAAISSTYVGSDIAQNDSDDLSVSGATVTAPAGYYAEDASASVANGSVTQNAPTVNSSTGLVTVTSTVTAGYVGSATKSNTLQLSTQGAQTITPGTTNQEIAAGKYLTGKQTIAGDADLVAANIKKGVDIFGVTGTFTTTPSGKTALTEASLRSGYAGFINGEQVNGSMADTSVTEGTTTVSNTTATRGTWSQTAGYTAARTIGAASFANTATNGITYVDISSTTDAPVLVSGGHLFINKGWTDNLKISLAKLVPDGASADLVSGVILSGYSAYNNDGVLVAGNIPTKSALTVSGKTVTAPAGYYASDTSSSVAVGTVTSGSASITSLTKTYNSTSGKFDISGSADVNAPSVGTAGYVSSSEGTRNKNTGGATVSTTIDKIVGSTVFSGASTRKPTILKQATPSGVTNAASGDATTTAPSSGVYVAVKTSANTGTLTATPSVTTAGYGDSTNHGIAANSITVGANASDTTYVPITTTSASVSGKTVSYGSGWITEGSKSVSDGVYSASVSSHSITTAPVVTGAISGTVTNIGTTTKPSGTDGTDYWTITPGGSVTTTGVSSAKGKATIGTAGYIDAGNKETSASTVNITPTVSNGSARYLPKATIAGSSTNATATTTVAPGTVSISKQDVPSGVTQAASGSATTTVPSSGIYVAVKATAAANSTGTTSSISGSGTATVTGAGYAPTTVTGSVTVSGTATAKTSVKDSAMTYVPINVGSITNNTSGGTSSGTINRGSQIKISAGYHASTVYYTAQSNSGTLTIDTSKNRGTISCNGYANVNVTGINIPRPSSGTNTFDVKVPNGNSTITFRFTVDTNGNVTVTNP